ncbi:MAG: hypothetical protein Q8K63_10870, partial [Acidimicrobiales bacterium]|nr:hypothetical protein [Acidimicrobiales bacterium]
MRKFPTVTAVVLAVVFLAILCVAPMSAQAAVTNPSFPRIAAWWPSQGTPASAYSKLDYAIPYLWEPMQASNQLIDDIRAINPGIVLLADASACELNYRQPDEAGNPTGPASYDAERIGA